MNSQNLYLLFLLNFLPACGAQIFGISKSGGGPVELASTLEAKFIANDVLSDEKEIYSSIETPTLVIQANNLFKDSLLTVYKDKICSEKIFEFSIPDGLDYKKAEGLPIREFTLSIPPLPEGVYEFFVLNSLSVDGASEETTSDCFSTGLKYTFDKTTPSAVILSLNNPNSSPAQSAKPEFKISSVSPSLLEIATKLKIFNTASCEASSEIKSVEITDFDLSEITLALSDDLAEGPHIFSVEVSDRAHNKSCGTVAVNYLHDSVAPIWSSPTGSSTLYNSISASPILNFVADASDGTLGSGIAEYQYAVSSALPVDGIALGDLKSWTAFNPASPLQDTSLSLTLGNTYYLSVRAVDHVGLSSNVTSTEWTAILPPTLSYTSSTGMIGTQGQAFSVTPSQLLPNGSPVSSCTTKVSTPTLPAWSSVNPNTCVITGTPDATLAPTQYTLVATNAAGASSDSLVTLSVAADVPQLSYTGATNTQIAFDGSSLSVAPTTLLERGSAITACAIKSGSTALPAWASVHSTTCVISGTPSATLAPTLFTLQASNSSGLSADATVTIGVGAAAPILSYASSTGLTGEIGTPMEVEPSTLDVRGSNLTACAIKTGTTALPAWASINASDCTISGTPTSALAATQFTIIATNTIGASADATVTLNVGVRSPTALARQNPTASTSNITNPTIRVSGGDMKENDSVKLFKDSVCANQVGTATVSNANLADITLNPALTVDGTYNFYAITTQNSVESSCSTASVAYVLDTGVPQIPAIAFSTPASSPSQIAIPEFVISATNDFESSDQISLHLGTSCGGTALDSTTGLSSVNSTLLDVGASLSQTTHEFSAKVTDLAGNTTCSLAHANSSLRKVTYLYDATSPTWADSLSISTPYNSLTNSSPMTLTLDADDGANGSGIASYEYAIGTASGLVDVLSWTTFSASPVSAASLSLSGGSTYHIQVRAKDNVGLASTALSKTWIARDIPLLSYVGASNLNVTFAVPMSVTPTTFTERGAEVTSCAVKTGTTTLPSWASIDSDCVITGTPTAILPATEYTIQAASAAGSSADATVTLSVGANVPVLSYSTSTGSSGSFGVAFSVEPSTFDERGAIVTACAIKSGTTALPAWASIDTDCKITGTPNATLTSTQFTLIATNSAGNSADATVTLSVAANTPVLSYASSTGTSGSVGVSFSVTPSNLEARGASVSACAIKSGSTTLPSWASINANTCAITGTPDAPLTSTQYTLIASNSAGDSADATVTLSVGASVPLLSYSGSTGTSGTHSESFEVTPSTLNNQGAAITNCAIKSGTTALPAGLTVNSSNCKIEGTPTAVVTATQYTVIATNSVGDSADANVTLSVAANTPVLSYASSTGTSGSVGVAFSVSPSTLQARGATVTNCTIKSGTTALPSWASLATGTCAITGTPDAPLTSTQYTLIATNSAGDSADATVTLSVGASIPLLSYSGSTGTSGTHSVAFEVTPSTLNNQGAAITNCAIKSGTTALPAGLTVNSSNCKIEGTPTAVVTTTQYTVIATNSVGNSADALVTLSVAANTPVLSYASSTGTSGSVGSAFSVSPTTLQARGATITTCDIKSGTTALPSWASVDDSTCVISGTPDAPLTSTQFTLIASNSVGASTDATVTLAVGASVPLLSYSSATGTSGSFGVAFSVTPTTFEERGANVTTCEIKSGTTALPAWASIDTDCKITGTPNATLTSTQFTIIASNSVGDSADATVTLSVDSNTPMLSYSGSTGTAGTFGTVMSVTPTTLNVRGAALSSCDIKSGTTALPAWASVDDSTCVISGTPTVPLAATQFTIIAVNASGNSNDATVSLSVGMSAPTTLARQNPSSVISNDSTPTIRVSGGSIANGNSVMLYSDDTCSTALTTAPGTSASSTQVDVTTNTLNEGTYSLYATVSRDGISSPCSSANVSYIVDTSNPIVPLIARQSPSAAYGTDSTPTFRVTLTGAVAFTASDTLSLYAQENCAGSAVETQNGITANSYDITATAQSEGSLTYSVKITDEAGNSSCQANNTGLAYIYDNTAPTWADSLALSTSQSASITTSPTISFDEDASDGAAGSGINSYEYAIGTGTSGAALYDIKAWTTAPSASFAATSLTLNWSTTYYISVRVKDNVGIYSSTHQTSFEVTGMPVLSYSSSTGTSGSVGVLMGVLPSTLNDRGSAITNCAIKTSTTALPAWAILDTTDCSIDGTPTAPLAST